MSVYRGNQVPKTITLRAKKDTLKPDLKELSKFGMIQSEVALDIVGHFAFTVESPKEYAGKKVLVVHGSKNGIIPQKSEMAMRLHQDADMIYCCYPRYMRWTLRDERVQWATIDKKLLVSMDETKDTLLITIKERKV